MEAGGRVTFPSPRKSDEACLHYTTSRATRDDTNVPYPLFRRFRISNLRSVEIHGRVRAMEPRMGFEPTFLHYESSALGHWTTLAELPYHTGPVVSSPTSTAPIFFQEV